MIVKLGTEFSERGESEIYMINGRCTQDGEIRQVGTKMTEVGSVGVAAGSNREREKIFVTVNFWNRDAQHVLAFSKGDRILAIGKMTSNKTNGKIYLSLQAEFATRPYLPDMDSSPGFAPCGNEPMLSEESSLPF